jgi:glycosyltransferase involved in cell wall biosynthesis
MKEAPLVSVITPCFKTERYLDVFLNALPRQTFFSKTQFVLDMNAPSQLEIQILKSFQKSHPDRLKVIISEKVANISTSMNRSIHNSDADTLAIWNVDDLRSDESLENQYTALKASNKPSFTVDSFEVVNKFGDRSGRVVDHKNLTQDDLLTGMFLGPFFMFSKEMINKIGYFDEQLYSGADFDFAIRLAWAVNPVYPLGVAGYYLDEGMGASTRPNSLQALERTVIELRYGIFHKIDPSFIYPASRYVIPLILNDNKFVDLKSVFKDYDDYIDARLKQIEGHFSGSFYKLVRKKFISYAKSILKLIVRFGR